MSPSSNRNQTGNKDTDVCSSSPFETYCSGNKSGDEYECLFNLSIDPLCIAGFDGYFKRLNPAWTRILGWTNEELTSKTWLEFVHPDDRKKTINIGIELIEGKSVFNFENRYICKDGTYRWLSWNSFPVPEEKLIFAVARDITEKKKSEYETEKIKKELIFEKNLLKKITETSPVGITVVDKTGRITFANSRAEEVLGLKKQEITELKYNAPRWKITDLNGDPFPEEKLPFNVVKNSGKPAFDIRHAIVSPEGKRILLSINATPLFDDDNNFQAIVATVEDITSDIISKRQLQLSEEKYRTIFNMTGVAMLIIENDTTISLVNRKFEEITGFSKDEIEGKVKWTEIVDPQYLKTMLKYHRMRRTEPGKAPNAYEFMLVDKQGNKRDILINIAIIPGTKKTVASFQDISSLKKLENELMDKNRELNDFAYMVSHDLKNPINLIMGFLMEIRDDPSLFDEYTNRTLSISRKMLDFINNLLKLSRSGKIIEEREKILIEDLVSNSYQNQKDPDIPSELIINCPQEYIKADIKSFPQVIDNLIQNCFKYRNPENEILTIEVKCHRKNEKIELSIRDNGSGIEEEFIPRIFKPGFSLGRGTGFGLAIVQKILAAHNATIEVFSQGENLGTEFIILLPA